MRALRVQVHQPECFGEAPGRNQKCALLRAKAELEMLRSGQAVQISEAQEEVHGLWRAVQERIAQRSPLQRTLQTEATSAAAATAVAEQEEQEESKCDRCGSQDGVIGGGANDYFINLCKRCFDKEAAGSKNI